SELRRLELSRDGQRLMVLHRLGEEMHVVVYDTTTVEKKRRRVCLERLLQIESDWQGHSTTALSPVSRWVATTDGEHVCRERDRALIYDLNSNNNGGGSGKVFRTLEHSGSIHSPAWGPDSATLAVGQWDSNAVYLWDVPSGKLLRVLSEQKGGEPNLVMSL